MGPGGAGAGIFGGSLEGGDEEAGGAGGGGGACALVSAISRSAGSRLRHLMVAVRFVDVSCQAWMILRVCRLCGVVGCSSLE